MTYVYRCIYFSFRNLIFHRELRHDPVVTRRLLAELERSSGPDEAKDDAVLRSMHDLMTQFLLASVGLRIAYEPQQRIPRGVWLTALQRETIKKVSAYGYHAGLLEN